MEFASKRLYWHNYAFGRIIRAAMCFSSGVAYFWSARDKSERESRLRLKDDAAVNFSFDTSAFQPENIINVHGTSFVIFQSARALKSINHSRTNTTSYKGGMDRFIEVRFNCIVFAAQRLLYFKGFVCSSKTADIDLFEIARSMENVSAATAAVAFFFWTFKAQ